MIWLKKEGALASNQGMMTLEAPVVFVSCAPRRGFPNSVLGDKQ